MIKLEITGNTCRHMYTMGPYYILITNKVSRNSVQMLTRSCADKTLGLTAKHLIGQALSILKLRVSKEELQIRNSKRKLILRS